MILNFFQAAKRPILSAAYLLWSALALPSASAAGDLTLEAAVTQALSSNPLLEAQGFTAQAQQARIAQARLGPALQLGMMVENAAGTGAFSSLSATESTLSLNWVLAGQLTAAQAAEAEAVAGALAQERALAQLDVSSETAFRFLAVLHAQGLSDLAAAQSADAVRAVALTKRLYETGQGGMAEWQQAQFDEERAALLQEEAHHDLTVARRQLAAQWGNADATFARAAGDWHRLPELPPLSELETGLARSPHLQRFEEEALRLKAAERVAEQNNKTLWTLNGGVRHFALGDDLALVASLTANLPQGRRRSAQARELGAEQNALAAKQAQASNLLHATLFELHAQLAHARHQVARLEGVLLPLLRESLSHYRAGYEQGLYDFPTVRRLEQERWSLERERLELAFEAHRTRIALERLSGLTLPAPAL